jgi:eukaryotic-like serine/threonine-protein kinase
MIGHTLGSYHVLAKLGEGGMGEVYRAHDTTLGRDVALKILPAAFAADPDRLMRFEREARTLAALNHPNIAQVHGLQESGADAEGAGGVPFRALVMELVEGEDLSARIARGPIPIDEALPIARQIADALAAAHDAGIIHRDLKPANVKLRADGIVKVLDFGLAKAGASGSAGGSGGTGMAGRPLLDSPTFTSPAVTQMGVILGTAAYMAPEQAKGHTADRRSDVWAFGVVLFEMITGRVVFDGESTVEVLGAVLQQPIEFDRLPADAPPAIRRLLRRCLHRDPKQRLRDIGDARLELDEALDAPESLAGRLPAPPSRRRDALLAGAAATLTAALAAALWMLLDPAAGVPERGGYHFTIPPPARDAEFPAISPDGRTLAYAAGNHLWVRALHERDPRRLDGTEGAREPFWSPDSRFIAFFAADGLKRITPGGGPPETLAAVPNGWPAGTWSASGTILVEVTETPDEGWYVLAPGASSLRKIRAFAADRAINPDKAYPSFLPDGEHFLFTHPVDGVATLQVGSIASDETRPLAPADSRAVYASSGFVLYVRNGTLLAQPFDPRALTLTGSPVTLVDDIAHFAPTGEASFSVSQTGTLAFSRRLAASQLRWFDRAGQPVGSPLQDNFYQSLALAPDGSRLAVEVNDPRRSTPDLWIIDLERDVPTRLTSSPRSELWPQWSPDGTRLVFSTDWEGPPNLYLGDAGGGEPRVLVPFDRTVQKAGGWTPDGKHVVYEKRNDQYGLDLWLVDVTTGERRPILATDFDESSPAVSPNGEWLTYVSNVSGRAEVYLRGFPDGSWQERLTGDGGRAPVWRADGQELFYYEPGGAIMAVRIDPGGSGRPRAGRPERLFQVDESTFRAFALAPDGQRLLLHLTKPGALAPPDEIVVDWLRWVSR